MSKARQSFSIKVFNEKQVAASMNIIKAKNITDYSFNNEGSQADMLGEFAANWVMM